MTQEREKGKIRNEREHFFTYFKYLFISIASVVAVAWTIRSFSFSFQIAFVARRNNQSANIQRARHAPQFEHCGNAVYFFRSISRECRLSIDLCVDRSNNESL